MHVCTHLSDLGLTKTDAAYECRSLGHMLAVAGHMLAVAASYLYRESLSATPTEHCLKVSPVSPLLRQIKCLCVWAEPLRT